MHVVPDRSKVQVRTRNFPKHFRHVVSDSFYKTYIKYIYIGFSNSLAFRKSFDVLVSNMYSRLSLSRNRGDPQKTVRDIRTSTYQICSSEEKTI